MNVRLQKSGQQIRLDKNDFLAEGGEGQIFIHQGQALKIYTDPSKALRLEKLNELAVLQQPNIATPLDLLVNNNGRPVGYVMNYIGQAEPLCRLFTNDFRQRNKIDEKNVANLVKAIGETLKFIHANNCLVVDLNEMNLLAGGKGFETPWFLDVDSYQTPSFPATAIMATVRDPHAKNFNALTDWYAFAILAFQLFVGIHPYKGTHPDFKRNDFVARMQANVSAFNPKVKLPPAARGLGAIPDVYRDWMIALFEQGARTVPPDVLGQTTKAVRQVSTERGQHLLVELLLELGEEILGFDGQWLRTANGFVFDQVQVTATSRAVMAHTTITRTPVKADIVQGRLVLETLEGLQLPLNIAAKTLLVVDGDLLVVGKNQLNHITLREMNGRILAAVKTTWPILPHATKIFDGLLFQDMLGVPHLTIPYRKVNGEIACRTFKVPELTGARMVEGRHEEGVAMILAAQNGQYDLLTMRFEPDWAHYTASWQNDVPYHKPNFATLPNGIVAVITPDGDLELSTRKGGVARTISDPAVTGDMRLYRNGASLAATMANRLVSIKTQGR